MPLVRFTRLGWAVGTASVAVAAMAACGKAYDEAEAAGPLEAGTSDVATDTPQPFDSTTPPNDGETDSGVFGSIGASRASPRRPAAPRIA